MFRQKQRKSGQQRKFLRASDKQYRQKKSHTITAKTDTVAGLNLCQCSIRLGLNTGQMLFGMGEPAFIGMRI